MLFSNNEVNIKQISLETLKIFASENRKVGEKKRGDEMRTTALSLSHKELQLSPYLMSMIGSMTLSETKYHEVSFTIG